MTSRTAVTRDNDTILRCTNHWFGHSWNTACTYGFQVWNPYLKQDMKKLEKVQKEPQNDSGFQGFELRGKVAKVCTNNTGEKEEQRRLNLSL